MSGGTKVEIKVPEIYRQIDGHVWDELETYLYRSFLTAHAHIAGCDFVFKTLNHHEVSNLEFHRPSAGSAENVQTRYRATLIAYSTFMLDGENVLVDRAGAIRKLINILEKMDVVSLQKIVDNLSQLNKKATYLSPLTEVYVNENRSRFKWFHSTSTPVNSPALTGIQGTDIIGMNHCQQTWTTLNNLQDIREGIERDWNNSKFIGSCFNGKGVKPIEEKDRGRREKERQDADELKVKVLYRYLNRNSKGEPIDPDETMTLPDGRKVIVDSRTVAQTTDELAAQLSASLSGEKDAHDIIIEKALKQLEERRETVESNKLNFYRAHPLEPDNDQGSFVLPGGKEEADARFHRMRRLQMEQSKKMFEQIQPDMDDRNLEED